MENDQRVLSEATLIQRTDDPADLVIHRGDHRRIGAAVDITDLLVLVDVLLRHLVRRMRCGESDIHEKRFA